MAPPTWPRVSRRRAWKRFFGQPVVVENRTGGNGAVGTQAVFNAAPDGYTLGMTSGSIMTVLP